MQMRMCTTKLDTDAYFASFPNSSFCIVSNSPHLGILNYMIVLFALLLQSKPLDADVKVTPQNLTLSLRPGNFNSQNSIL